MKKNIRCDLCYHNFSQRFPPSVVARSCINVDFRLVAAMIRFPNQVAKRALHFNSSTLDEISRLLHARPRFSLRTEKPRVKLAKFKPPTVTDPSATPAAGHLAPVAADLQGPPLPSPDPLSAESPVSYPPFVRVSLSESTDLATSDPAFVRLAMGSLLERAKDGSPPPTRLSAVLIPLCLDAGIPSVLFIQRSRRMRHHRGQAAFPGGMMDPADWGDPVRCAVRETQEEVGVGWAPRVWPATARRAGREPEEASASVLGVGPHAAEAAAAGATAAPEDTSVRSAEGSAVGNGEGKGEGSGEGKGWGAAVDVILLGLHHDCSTVERHRPTGTVITPVVGFLPQDVRSLPLSLSPEELRRAFCIPLEALCRQELWGEIRGRPSFAHQLGVPYRVTVPASALSNDAPEAAAGVEAAAKEDAHDAVLRCFGAPVNAVPAGVAGAAGDAGVAGAAGDAGAAGAATETGSDEERVEIDHVPFVLNCTRSTSDNEGWSDEPYNSEDEDSGRGQTVVVWGATAWMLSVFLKQVVLKIK